MPRPFIVIATQNPVEHEGTYRLPEAQLDRFLMRITLGYPDPSSEREVLLARADGASVDDLGIVLTVAEVRDMLAVTAAVEMSDKLADYVVALVSATRTAPGVRLGVSPRGTLALGMAAKTLAASRGRWYVTGDDVQELARPVLAHRMLLTPAARLDGVTAESVLDRLVDDIPLPRNRAR